MEALIVGGKVCMGKYGRKVFTIIGIQKPLEFIGGVQPSSSDQDEPIKK